MRINDDYIRNLSIEDKIKIIMGTAESVVTREYGYIPLLEDIVFQYNLLKTCGAIEEMQDFFFFFFEEKLQKNRGKITEIMNTMDSVGELKDACHDAVMYRIEHGTGTLLDDMIVAIINWINAAAGHEIDMDAIQNLRDIIPLLKDVDTVDVAKAIIGADKKRVL